MKIWSHIWMNILTNRQTDCYVHVHVNLTGKDTSSPVAQLC